MWRCLPLLLLSLAACGGDRHQGLAMGSPAPDFALPGVDGKTHTLAEYAKSPVLVLVFTCNHCPASQFYEQRIKKLHEDYRGRGVSVVAVNPENADGVRLSDLAYSDVGDSLPEMKARATHRHLDYPYLYDGDTQALASALGVAALPQVFVFDRQRALQYQGRIDDNPRGALAKTAEARDAIEALLSGQRVPVARTTAVGCPVTRSSKPPARQTEMAQIAAEPVVLQMADQARLKRLRGNDTGKLLLVNFWATWCGPCITEFPDLEATYRMYRGRGLDFVSVSANDPDDKPQVVAFLQKHHASSTNLQFGTPDTFDLQAAFDPLMPAAVPFTVLITPGGDIVYQELGELNILSLRRAILANLPDDAAHAGQQAYWSGH
jgi:thiol-disulfide isomerase/thioredoxin